MAQELDTTVQQALLSLATFFDEKDEKKSDLCSIIQILEEVVSDVEKAAQEIQAKFRALLTILPRKKHFLGLWTEIDSDAKSFLHGVALKGQGSLVYTTCLDSKLHLVFWYF